MARAQYWLLRHRRVGRPLKILVWLQLLVTIAVCTAPAATASTNAAALNWTGLHDNNGVPIGDFYLSLASVADQITQAGPDASMLDPSTWWPWLMHALIVLANNFTAANILTAEASVFVGIIALSLWLMRLTISTYWLTVLGEIAKAITTAVTSVITRWGLIGITVPIGVFVGVLAIRRGEHGRGWTMIMAALTMPALAVTVFSDPAGTMYGPNGLLVFGRRMAFSTAQAATHNGAISGGGFTGQVDTLTSSLITHVVREPLQVFNFGHVVDKVGICGAQYSQALLQGGSDGPVKAMARCDDLAAVNYAQHLDGTNVFVGLVLMITAVMFGWFMVSSGASVFMVSVKAIYTTAKLLPSVFAGGISGPAQEHAKATVWRYFKHPLEVMVYIVFVSVMGLAIERLISRPLPAELGGTNPFAHILIIGGASLTALYLLHHVKADLEGRPSGRGLFGRATDVALGLSMHAALGGAGSAALGGARGLRGMFGRGGQTPWDRRDEQADKAGAGPEEVLGEPQEGFAPVPNQTDAATPGAGPDIDGQPTATEPGQPNGGGQQAINAPVTTRQGIGIDPLTSTANVAAQALQPPRQRGRKTSGRGGQDAALQPTLETASWDGRVAAWDSGSPTHVDPISDTANHRGADAWEGAPPLSAYADPTSAEIPPPTEPPHDDGGSPPPPENPWGQPANVDPITGQ
jgi:hypothetical protein